VPSTEMQLETTASAPSTIAPSTDMAPSDSQPSTTVDTAYAPPPVPSTEVAPEQTAPTGPSTDFAPISEPSLPQSCNPFYEWSTIENQCVPMQRCPVNYEGTPPNCTPLVRECPPGYEGTYPDCTLITAAPDDQGFEKCPPGQEGVPPDCRAIEAEKDAFTTEEDVRAAQAEATQQQIDALPRIDITPSAPTVNVSVRSASPAAKAATELSYRKKYAVGPVPTVPVSPGMSTAAKVGIGIAVVGGLWFLFGRK